MPMFLHHIATLLTRGTAKDKDAEDVVAIMATIEEFSIKMLVAQNSPNARQNVSEPFKLDITIVKKTSWTLEEIYKRYHRIVCKFH